MRGTRTLALSLYGDIACSQIRHRPRPGAGIATKLTSKSYMAEFSQKWYVLCFYILNLVMVSLDIAVYFRNRRLDAKNGK